MEAHEPRARRGVSWLGAAVRGNDLATDLLQGGIVMINGGLLLWLCPVDAEQSSDRVDPFRCGLHHLSFGRPGGLTWRRRRRSRIAAATTTADGPELAAEDRRAGCRSMLDPRQWL